MQHSVRKPTQSWRPRFRQRIQLLVPAYTAVRVRSLLDGGSVLPGFALALRGCEKIVAYASSLRARILASWKLTPRRAQAGSLPHAVRKLGAYPTPCAPRSLCQGRAPRIAELAGAPLYHVRDGLVSIGGNAAVRGASEYQMANKERGTSISLDQLGTSLPGLAAPRHACDNGSQSSFKRVDR